MNKNKPQTKPPQTTPPPQQSENRTADRATATCEHRIYQGHPQNCLSDVTPSAKVETQHTVGCFPNRLSTTRHSAAHQTTQRNSNCSTCAKCLHQFSGLSIPIINISLSFAYQKHPELCSDDNLTLPPFPLLLCCKASQILSSQKI